MSLNPINVLNLPLKYFTICGLWPKERRFYWPYIIYSVIFQSIFTFCYTSFKCINFLFLTDVKSITIELYVCASELSLCVKVINFLYHQKEMKLFLVNVKKFKLLSQFEEEFLKKRLDTFTMILVFQLICCQIAIVFSCCAPFFAEEPVLPYLAWYPLDWYNDRKSYWYVYCYQVLGIFNEANNTILLDLYVIYLLIVVGAHLDILAMRLSKLGYSNEEEALTPDDSYVTLTDSVEVHKVILKFQKSIEQAFSAPLFVQFIIAGLILCITSFQIATIKPAEDAVNLIFYLSFTVVVTLEIFLPCYFGTQNIFKSNYLITAVYSSNWTTFSTSSRKAMITFMEGLMQPKVLLSGKLVTLTLSTFLAIANRTYSLFAVLKKFLE